MRKFLSTALLCLALPGFVGAALAQDVPGEEGQPAPETAPAIPSTDPLSATAFDSYTRGKTLYYGKGGTPYGVEQYMSGHRVRWSFLDGNCQEGTWYENADQICFVYEGTSDPQCWSFYLGASGLTAQFRGDGEETVLYQVRNSPEPMQCEGPRVGV